MFERRKFIAGLLGVAYMDRVDAMSLKQDRLEQAAALIKKSTDSGEVSAASLYVRQREIVFQRAFGRAHDPDSVFLLASITKPMTAIGVMMLVDRGQLTLSDPVRKHIPEFTGGERDLVTIRHLLTHTSGLPDQLEENVQLRKRHAPLKDFVAATCRTPLLFKPGTQVKYQSMGLLLAAEIAERVTKRPFRDFLGDEFFRPAGMTKTSLGLGGRRISDTMLSQVAERARFVWRRRFQPKLELEQHVLAGSRSTLGRRAFHRVRCRQDAGNVSQTRRARIKARNGSGYDHESDSRFERTARHRMDGQAR